MTKIMYLTKASTELYGEKALAYIGNDTNKGNIITAANNTGVSASAIAGAMAEENNDYWLNLKNILKNEWSDKYAQSSIDPAVFVPLASELGFEAALAALTAQLARRMGKT